MDDFRRKFEMTCFLEELTRPEGVLSKLKLEGFDPKWVEEMSFS